MEPNAVLDCKGLSCPMPIVKLSKKVKEMKAGEILELIATDPGSKADIPSWCSKTGNEFLQMKEENGTYHFLIGVK